MRMQGMLAASAALLLGMIDGVHAQGMLEASKKSGKVVVGIYNQAPWGFQTADGKISGQAVDVLMTAFKRMGIHEFTPVISEFSALNPGSSGKAFRCGRGRALHQARSLQTGGVRKSRYQNGNGLLVRTGNPHNIHSYEDVAKKPAVKIGTARGNVQAQTATTAGVPADRQLLFPDNQSALSGLIAGRVDAVLFHRSVHRHLSERRESLRCRAGAALPRDFAMPTATSNWDMRG